MRVLLDTGVFGHSEFGDVATKPTAFRWGAIEHILPVVGLVRKSPDEDPDLERQHEALFTVGRLIRQGRIEAYQYIEIRFERMRGRAATGACNALQDCQIHTCRPALNRSKFRRSVRFTDVISKGGKKDRKAGIQRVGPTQIDFFRWLYSLKKGDIDLLVRHAAVLGLTEFEVESLNNLQWFQFLCQRWRSEENYPDVFHLWTAERNDLDAFLTMEKGLPNFVSSIRMEKVKRIEIKTGVLRPLDLLQKFGIDRPDPVPMDPDRFYYLHEIS